MLLDVGVNINHEDKVCSYYTQYLGKQRELLYLVCVCVCLSACLMHIFSDTESLYIAKKVSTASVQHGADYYENIDFGSSLHIHMINSHTFHITPLE